MLNWRNLMAGATKAADACWGCLWLLQLSTLLQIPSQKVKAQQQQQAGTHP
jgi:hypothetical protein